MYEKKPWLKFYEDVPETLDYPRISMFESLMRSVEEYPDSIAYDFMGYTSTYIQFAGEIERFANTLAAIGLKKGDRITISMPTTPQGIICFYAANKLGAVASMIHPLSTASEIEFYLNVSKSKFAMTLDAFYGAINTVTPSFIRVEADELTYNLHVILRFEIERALFTGELAAQDVPAAWNEKMDRLLGITPPTDRDGCLQDIHWSIGLFGYFPAYTLGNLYAAQFFDQAVKDIPDLFDRIAVNDHRPLLDWLREKIHCHGRRYRANELIELVTGRPLSIEPFMNHVTEKFSAVYRL